MRTILLGLLLVMLTAAGCTGEEPVANEPSEPSIPMIPEEQESAPDRLAFEETSNSKPAAGDQLRIGLTRPESFVPSDISMLDQSAVIIADLLYDGLTEADPKAGTLRPALASEWSHNEDFSQWSFAIDNEARVRPSAIVAYFQGLISSPPSGTTAFLLGSITSVSADDDANVVFDLVGPNAGFAWMVSGLQFSIVGADDGLTGRYRIESDSEEKMLLSPIVEGPQLSIIWTKSEFDAYDKMTLGQLDMTVAAPQVIADAALRYGAEFEDVSVAKFFVLNPRSPLTGTLERREALQLAIDQDDLLDGRLPETTVAATGILARSMSGTTVEECGLVCEFDVDQAAQLFDQTLATSTIQVGVIWPDQYGVGEEIAKDLTNAGLDTEVVELTSDALTAAVFSGEIDIFSFGWISGATSIDAVIPAILGPSSPVELSGDSAAVIESLLAKAATTESDADRWEILNQAHQEALSIGIVIPISTETHRLVRTPDTQKYAVRADGSIDVFGLSQD